MPTTNTRSCLCCLSSLGDDSSNEGEGEEAVDGENGEKMPKVEEEEDVDCDREGAPKEPPPFPEEVVEEEMSTGRGEVEEEKKEEQNEGEMEVEENEDDICFPDTSISLSHLQPGRWASLWCSVEEIRI